jgi:hypothetical protein
MQKDLSAAAKYLCGGGGGGIGLQIPMWPPEILLPRQILGTAVVQTKLAGWAS